MSACAQLMHILFIGNFCEQPAQLLAPRIEYIRSTRHPCSVFGAWPSPLRLSDHSIFEGGVWTAAGKRSITQPGQRPGLPGRWTNMGVVVECVFGCFAALGAYVSVPVKACMRAECGCDSSSGLT